MPLSPAGRALELASAAALGGLLVWALLKRRPVALAAAAAAPAAAPRTSTGGPLRLKSSPKPTWKPGQPQKPPFSAQPEDVISRAPSELKNAYFFWVSAYVPRPIAFVSTISADGVPNLAPFSYSGLFNHDPAILCFSCVDKGRAGGDTLHNVKATKECVIHIISDWFVEAANHTCGSFPPEVNEFKEAGLSMLPSSRVAPFRCGEAALAFECKVVNVLPIQHENGKVTATMVLCQVVYIHANKHVLHGTPESFTVDAAKLRPVARLGGNDFVELGDFYDIDRPRVEGSGSSNQALTDGAFNYLASLAGLQRLRIEGCPAITQKAVLDFKTQRPLLSVVIN
eukprot:g83021.t1